MMKKAGLNMEIFSGGGTGTYNIMHHVPGFTDLQVGSYLFMDMQYLAIGSESGDAVYNDFAPSLTVLTTVLNNRFPGRLTTDAGAKALTLNTPTAGVIGEPGMAYNAGSDEFGGIRFDDAAVEGLQDRRQARADRAALRSGRERVRPDVRDPQGQGRGRVADHGQGEVAVAHVCGFRLQAEATQEGLNPALASRSAPGLRSATRVRRSLCGPRRTRCAG